MALKLRPGSQHSVAEFKSFLEPLFPRVKRRRDFRLIVQSLPPRRRGVTERTIDKRGQHLLMPEIELQGGWTSLSESPDSVIQRDRQHGTHEQFHSEFKSDLGLERLPSGKFDTNDAILSLAMLAYNSLRLMGQLGLTGEITPIRRPAQRRRLKTVLQEVMHRAAKRIHHARRWILDFGHGHEAHVEVFALLQERLRTPQPAT